MRLLVLMIFICSAKSFAVGVKIIDDVDNDLLRSVIVVNPMYPEQALKNKLNGKCDVEFKVSPTGNVIADETVVSCNPEGFFESSCLIAINFRTFVSKSNKEEIMNSSCLFEY